MTYGGRSTGAADGWCRVGRGAAEPGRRGGRDVEGPAEGRAEDGSRGAGMRSLGAMGVPEARSRTVVSIGNSPE